MFVIINWMSIDYADLSLVLDYEDSSPILFETEKAAYEYAENLNGYWMIVNLY